MQKEAFLLACQQHQELHTRERMSYSNRVQVSQLNAARIIHLVFDCPDSYDVPHITPVTKESANLPKISVNAVGTINHTTHTRDYMFFLDIFKKNSNLILSCFYLHIIQHFETQPHHPQILWLQADNCFKENKNRWMLGFCHWLIHLGWFQEIVISMLPPGHTHIDIDQMFSTLAINLKSNNIETPYHLIDRVNHAYRKEATKPTAAFIPDVWNFIGFLAPFVRDIGGLNTAHVFLIRKLPDGAVGMKCKKWHSTDDTWTGSLAAPDEWIQLLTSKPPGHPEVIAPEPIEDMLTLADINKYQLWLHSGSGKIWQKLIEDEEMPATSFWPISTDMWNFSKVNICCYFCISILNSLQFPMSTTNVSAEQLQALMQDVSVSITIGQHSSVSNATAYPIPVPTELPVGMMVAVKAANNSADKFWIAVIQSERSDDPLQYNLRYYAFNKSKKGWYLMKGASAYGWAPHEAILVAGLELNQNCSMRESSIKRITQALAQE